MLIDNAEAARISKKLVTLDDRVPLDVPVENLGVHEPDYKTLIAFLKSMGFKTLTQRVAEKAASMRARSRRSKTPAFVRLQQVSPPSPIPAQPRPPEGTLPLDARSAAQSRGDRVQRRPHADFIGDRRSEAARTVKIDRSQI